VNSKAELERALIVYSTEQRVLKRKLEQYPTPTQLVAHVVWLGLLKGDIGGQTIADYGCGDGRLAVASLLVGASRALCVEIDEELLRLGLRITLQYYYPIHFKILFIVGDATRILLKNINTIIMNPPFGVVRSNRGLDVKFLISALKTGRKVYSFHKYSEGFVMLLEKIIYTLNLDLEYRELMDFEIPMLYNRHRRRTYRFKAVLIILARKVIS
jgi:putative methylase